MYVWPTTVSGNADREVQFNRELQFIPQMKMDLCLVRDFESRKQRRQWEEQTWGVTRTQRRGSDTQV